MFQKITVSSFGKTTFVTVAVVGIALLFQNCGQGLVSGAENGLSANFGETVDASCTVAAPHIPVLPQRLVKAEYQRVVRDIFGFKLNETAPFVANWSDDPSGILGYSTEASSHTLSPTIIDEYWNSASLVADALIPGANAPFLTCTAGLDCAENLIKPIMRKAFRRTPTTEELNDMRALFNELDGANFQTKIKGLVRAVLMSPQFIFRTFEKPQIEMPLVPLTGVELASRLSFFMWGSVPDEQLLKKAESGQLLNPGDLESEIRRMLADPKSEYLATGFFWKWMQLDNSDEVNLDATIFKQWNANMRNSMKQESLSFFTDLIANDLDLVKVINADYSFLNSSLADLYEISGNFNAGNYTKAPLNNERRGFLTQGSFLMMTSASDHTAPVIRGKFVLERLLCSAPPAPPNTVPPLEGEDEGNYQSESKIRERLKAHQSQGTTCYGCHASMDPIGLGFENYSSIGSYRSQYVDGVAVNASGRLPTGEGFDSALDLVSILEDDQRYRACVAGHLVSFATGQDRTEKSYRCYNHVVGKGSVGKEHKLSDLIIAIAKSPEFLNRKPTQ